MSTVGKNIECRAAVLWEPNKPLTIETVTVEPPKAGEIRIKVIANSICFTDVHCYLGHLDESVGFKYPCILGHEASGIVESIGEGITEFAVGDTVLSSFMPNCKSCKFCLNPHTNICLKRKFDETTMSDGTTRFKTKDGKPIYHYLGISAFSEFTVLPDSQAVKIDPSVRLDRVCILACGFGTGFGSSSKVANVRPGSTVGVWGLGAIGLAAVAGAKHNGAKTIIGIDLVESKEAVCKKVGCTHFINPKKVANFDEEIKKLTDGNGLDYAVECIGNVHATKTAISSVAPWGTVVIVGVYQKGKTIDVLPNEYLAGKKITGGLFGGFKSKTALPEMVQLYKDNKIQLDDFFTHTIKLEQVNEAIQMLIKGEALRSVIMF